MSSEQIIFVVTNNSQLGTTDAKTGWYLPEVAHPYDVLRKAGHQITFVSPKGGKSPMDVGSGEAFKDDPICRSFLSGPVSQLDNTLTASAINPSEYKALFYAGGHGPMFDLPAANDIAALAAKIYAQGGVLAAVCHGVVGFVPIRLPNGDSLVKGQTVTSFTNAEEDAVSLSSQMPFMLETKLKELGANFVSASELWNCCVKVSGRLVTGQNPASATQLAEELVKLLK